MKYPAVKALIFLIIGIIGASYIKLSAGIPLAIALVSIVSLLMLFITGKTKYIGWLIAALLIAVGFFRSQLFITQLPSNHISKFTSFNSKIQIKGEIALEPDIRDKNTYLTIASDSAFIAGRSIPVTGRVMIKIRPPTGRYQYGDYISVFGYLNKPPRSGNPDLFNYREYLRKKAIFAYCAIRNNYSIKLIKKSQNSDFISAIVLPIRQYLINAFHHLPTSDNGHLLSGFLLGEKRGIPLEIKQSFITSGTMHLLAVSGSNVVLVSFLYYLIMRYVPITRKWKIIGSVPVIVTFCFMTNNEPSVVRATMMFLIGTLAFLWRRRLEIVNSVSSAALIILSVNPLWLFDAGFQLSFAAVGGIIAYMKSGLYWQKRPRRWFEMVFRYFYHGFYVSCFAFLFTLPVTAYHYNRIALYSIISNIPAAAVIMFVTVIGSVYAVVYPIGGIISGTFSWLADRSVMLMYLNSQYFASLPFANLMFPTPGIITITIFYLVLIAAIALKRNRVLSKYSIIAVLTLLCIKVWWGVFDNQKDDWFVEFLDCGYSSALIVHNNSDYNVLIYSGDSRTYKGLGEKIIRPYILKIGHDKIRNLVFTECGSDAVNGMEQLLKDGFVENLWIPHDSEIYKYLISGDFKMHIREYFSSDTLIYGKAIKQTILSSDINLKEKRDNVLSYPSVMKILNSSILYLGKSEYFPEYILQDEIEIIQIDAKFAEWLKNYKCRDEKQIIITGEPYCYWMDFSDTTVTSKTFRIKEQGAISARISSRGIVFYHNN
ncbi:MAG: ComEC family competence protein [candidate division Zixibacteria bacterium]|nr:ComEC family competence protein [candidate division Zixibacteria bacterium]